MVIFPTVFMVYDDIPFSRLWKVVDEGWAPFDIQIGQTGKTIAPELYIACGISGTLQHSIGVKNAKKIIAINTDPVAPIFSMSDISILGDAKRTVR
jgi:electron transfer flavoprotein alpha subunit